MPEAPRCLLTNVACTEGCTPRSLKCDWSAMRVARPLARDVVQGIRTGAKLNDENKQAFVEASVEAIHHLNIRQNPEAIGAFVGLTMQHAAKQIAGQLGVVLEIFDQDEVARMSAEILSRFPPPTS